MLGRFVSGEIFVKVIECDVAAGKGGCGRAGHESGASGRWLSGTASSERKSRVIKGSLGRRLLQIRTS